MTTYYEKKGNRYVPVLEKDVWSGDVWPKGCHLVTCKPGTKVIRYNIEPDDAAFFAAKSLSVDKIAKMFLKASKAKCKVELLTQEQKKAWENLENAFDGGPYYIQYSSALEMAEMFLDLVKREQSSLKEDECLYIGDIEEK